MILNSESIIAVIGSGISGLTTAYSLSKKFKNVVLFESENRIGGHTNTIEIETDSGQSLAIDTGFIVFNDWTYPNFISLMDELGVPSQESDMGFSVRADAIGLEYNGKDLNHLFIQRKNLLRPSYFRMLLEILRFNKLALNHLQNGLFFPNETLHSFLERHEFQTWVTNYYIVPMGAAIWSASVSQMLDFPVEFFTRFFKNHGMMSVDERPTWRVIQGGSKSYLKPITKNLSKLALDSPVEGVERYTDKVTLKVGGKNPQTFNADQVVFACHSDQALKILSSQATTLEKEILGQIGYQENVALLHTDISILPKNKRAWASWNYWISKNKENQRVPVSYWMNKLQSLRSDTDYIVSLNMEEDLDPKKILRKIRYHHPVFSTQSFQSQARWSEISGHNRTHFCGAYWSYGFHEDGVRSGLRVAEHLEKHLAHSENGGHS